VMRVIGSGGSELTVTSTWPPPVIGWSSKMIVTRAMK
jgi:hypothetical protein